MKNSEENSEILSKYALCGDFLGLASSQEWKKGDVVFVLQYPLHGRNLVVYRHQDSIFWKRKFGMIFFDIRQDVSNTGFLWKPDLNPIALGFRPLQPQEGNRDVHSLNLTQTDKLLV
jgi:hypothetical protein